MYDALARHYDALIDVDYYARWYDYVDSLLIGRTKGMDIGCGSGAFTVELARRGKDIVGADVSESMLEAAFDRAVKAGVKPRFVRSCAESFVSPKPLDFVTAMNDVVNYMKNPKPFFKAAARALGKGGMLLFDISSEHKLKNTIAGNTFCLKGENVTCVWESSKAAGKSLDYYLSFYAARDDGLYELETETQTQYIHTSDDIVRSLGECGFSVKVYGDLTRRSPKANAERIHFAAIKK